MEATSSPSSSSSSSALSHKSKERVFHLSPRKTHNSKFTPLFVFVLCISFIPIPTSAFEATYDQHCNPIVPRSPSLPDRFAPSSGSAGLPSPFRLGFFRGGAPLLSQNPANDVIHRAQFMRFGPYGAVKTNADGVYAFRARLSLQDFSGHRVFGDYTRRGLRSVRLWGLKSPVPRYSSFSLMGFWSEASRKLCMVGSGSAGPGHSGIAHSILSVVLKLN
ncbi:hypothetical protein TorRG33x02_041950 [Trema orientale]|uniref:DUF2921 domain-containing protein n=1 Tax=Trema orientale TaxID=63057 RepID=A0A2P5FQI3_TREOI|nr:hypothetical protein TorRG33x02_041950 [Trema orientale]